MNLQGVRDAEMCIRLTVFTQLGPTRGAPETSGRLPGPVILDFCSLLHVPTSIIIGDRRYPESRTAPWPEQPRDTLLRHALSHRAKTTMASSVAKWYSRGIDPEFGFSEAKPSSCPRRRCPSSVGLGHAIDLASIDILREPAVARTVPGRNFGG